MFNFKLGKKNKYYTLYSEIRKEILRGKIKEGTKLPSKRSLAEDLGVSVVTVQLAYEQLFAEGYVRTEERKGYFVERVESIAATVESRKKMLCEPQKKQYKIDLVKGSTPAHMFPFSTWAKLIRLVLADCGEHLLERVPCGGDYELKSAISDYLYRSRGIDADPERIIIGAGSEHLYGVIVQLLGRDTLFAVENPGYGKISSTYSLNGANWVAVDVDERGMNIEKLASVGADAAHVSPSHQFPTGAVMPVSVRSKLINWAERGERFVIEDDYDSEFRLFGKPLESTYALCPEKVIYMNTFSKSLAPSMRLGYMVLPAALYEKYMSLFSTSANIVPLFEQKALAAMLNGGHFERHISRLKNYYRGVRNKLLERLDGICEVRDTGSGLHVIAKFPQAKNDGEIKEEALSRGVNIRCLSDYLLSPMDGVEKCAVINYSGLTL